MKDKYMSLLGVVAVIAIVFLVMLFQAQIVANAIKRPPGFSGTRIGQNIGTQNMYLQFLEKQKSVQMPSGPGGGQMLPGMYSGSAGGQSVYSQQQMLKDRYLYPQADSQQLQYKAIQGSMQRGSQEISRMSQMQKTRHDESMAAIRRMK